VLTTARDKATASLGATLHEKRPGWLGGHPDQPASSPAGSNGHQG
jgi:hypothetical protein